MNDDLKRLTQQITDQALTEKFIKEAGHKARVERTEVDGDERTEALKLVLQDIGADLLESGKVPKGMTYVGSIACHIYKSEIMSTAAFFKQITSANAEQNIPLMKAAALELAGEIDFALTGKRATKRSGFSG